MSNFKNIPIKDIELDHNQPRKYFNRDAMDELASSIQIHGVIEPLMVRPAKEKNKYILVVGERRLRAAGIVMGTDKDRNTVPAIIRELNDEQALEIQLEENTKRQDLHPMEEAHTYQSMFEIAKHSVAEIALRVSKSEKYVAQRLKLVDLTPNWQEIFYTDRMTLSQALTLSKAGVEIQNELYKELVPEDWETYTSGYNRPVLWSVDDDIIDAMDNKMEMLTQASFPIDDATIYPKMGACSTCQYNSLNQPLLFEELKQPRCQLASCFAIKTEKWQRLQMEALATDPDRIAISTAYYLDKDAKQKLQHAKDAGINVLEKGSFEIADNNFLDLKVQEFKDYVENEYDTDEDDFDWNDPQLKKEYEDYVQEMQEEIEEEAKRKEVYEAAKKEGRVKKAYVIAGNQEGKEVEVILAGKVAEQIAISSGDADAVDVLEEIRKIELREERNEALDRENIFKTAIEQFKDTYTSKEQFMDSLDWKALAMLLVEFSFDARDNAPKIFGFDDCKYTNTADALYHNIPDAHSHIDILNITKLIRTAIYDKLINIHQGDYKQYGKAGIMYNLVKQWQPEEVEAIEEVQAGIAAERKSKMEKRIAALRKKLEKVEA